MHLLYSFSVLQVSRFIILVLKFRPVLPIPMVLSDLNARVWLII